MILGKSYGEESQEETSQEEAALYSAMRAAELLLGDRMPVYQDSMASPFIEHDGYFMEYLILDYFTEYPDVTALHVVRPVDTDEDTV